MNNERDKLYLAALLHDIGKFYQRADTGTVKTSRFLSSEIKNSESLFCPKGQNSKYTHKHVLWSAQFIYDHRQVFANLTNGEQLTDLSNKEELINLVASHHLQENQLSELGRLIKKADHLSSGMDRNTYEAFKDDQAETSWDSFKKIRMTSILEGISVKEKTCNYHQPILPMCIDKTMFASTTFEKEPDYTSLWNKFVNEFKFIQSNTYHAFSETLLNLMYKYTTCIPASTVNFPDVSLYDHAKTTAAIAVCLYDYTKQNTDDSLHPLLLIGADISGIQKYIYQIINKGASKNLKGRSFYIKLLSDAIVRTLLKELDLYQANIIYNSGGGFFILSSNTEHVNRSLNSVLQKIESQIFKTHQTSLYVAIDSVPVSEDALMHRNNKNLGQVWSDLFEKRDLKKQMRYATLLKARYEDFFEPQNKGGNSRIDSITGEELAEGECLYDFEQDKLHKLSDKLLNNSDIIAVKEITHRQKQLGRMLRESPFMIVSENKLSYWENLFHIEPAELGIYYYFPTEKDIIEKENQLKGSADKVSVITLNGKDNNYDFLWKTFKGVNNIYGFDFYGGNDFPRDKRGDVLTFEDLLCTDESSNSDIKRLGILRMDVDNLGKIFQSGISSERATLSRYAALSRSFDWFFSGYLNTIWKQTAPSTSMIIYSGGDDLFIVGKWTHSLMLAKQIQKDFKEYTCGNPAFSLSGGVALVTSKFPIMKAAELSAQSELAAKSYRHQNNHKNAITFLSIPLSWNSEFAVVENIKNEILSLVTSSKLPKSFLSKITTHALNADIKDHQIKNLKTYWMATYDLSRMANDIKNKEADILIRMCQKEICAIRYDEKVFFGNKELATPYHPLELWNLACRWAELESRTTI